MKALVRFLLLIALLLLPGLPSAASAQEKPAADGRDGASEDDPAADAGDDVPEALRSPRATMQTLLTSANRGRYEEAAETLDLEDLPGEISPARRVDLARKLKGVIDRIAWVDLAEISNSTGGDAYRFPPDAEQQPIVVARQEDGAWKFTAETVARLDALWESYKDQPRIVAEVPWYRDYTIVGNELWRIFALFLSLLLAWLIGRIARFAFNQAALRFERRDHKFYATMLQAVGKALVPIALVFGLSAGMEMLLLEEQVEQISDTVISVLFACAVAYAAYCLIDVVDRWMRSIAERTSSKLDDMISPMVRTCLKVTIFILLLVQIATILSDKPITSVIAGLGVGGLAIGLAAQDTIKNFFGSLMIFADRPFELGDRIVIDGHDGPVERVGFRSTAMRTLEGHVVTIPNGELASKTIQNIGKRPNIRRIMNIGITYDTPPEKVEEAVRILEEILADHEGMAPGFEPRVFFNDFNDSSLNIFAIYWYHPPDWWAYCEFSQWVNMELFKRFNAAGIEFAFPSQTIYLAGGEQPPSLTAGNAGPGES